jgi:hypothetical protein
MDSLSDIDISAIKMAYEMEEQLYKIDSAFYEANYDTLRDLEVVVKSIGDIQPLHVTHDSAKIALLNKMGVSLIPYVNKRMCKSKVIIVENQSVFEELRNRHADLVAERDATRNKIRVVSRITQCVYDKYDLSYRIVCDYFENKK